MIIIDAFNYINIVEELRTFLKDSFIQKITFRDAHTLVLRFRTSGRTYEILISLKINEQMLFEIADGFVIPALEELPGKVFNLQMLMRKKIRGRLLDVRLIDFDRVICFEWEGVRIILEMMGINSNLIITDKDDQILDCYKRQKGYSGRETDSRVDFENRARHIYPGAVYKYPLNKRKIPVSEHIPDNLSQFRGFSSVSRDLISDIGSQPIICSGQRVLLKKGKRYHPFPVSVSDPDVIMSGNYSELLSEYYFNIRPTLAQSGLLEREVRNIRDIIEKKEKQYKKHLHYYKDSGNEEMYRKYADILMANLHRKVSEDPFTAEDIYSGGEIKIPIDKRKNVQQNAQHFYDLCSKEKKRRRFEKVKADDVQEELKDLREYLDRLESGEVTLEQKKKIKKEKSSGKDRLPGKIRKLEKNGTLIYIGGSAKDNDYILSHIAKGNDTWFHINTIKGAHVIVKRRIGELSPGMIEYAAGLAARNSRSGRGALVAVDYTSVKYVNKVKGVPGKVTFSNNKTVMVKL